MFNAILFLFICFLWLGYAVLIFCYRRFWKQAPNIDHHSLRKDNKPFISIIIPARNEEHNIGALLNSILLQTYDSKCFEVMVMDDFSTDKTPEIIKSFKQPHIHYYSLKDFIGDTSINAYKKKAISTAVSLAKGELMVTIDADCTTDPLWLETIAAFYCFHQPEMIVMPVVISSEKSFIQLFQQLDFMSLQGITGGAVYKKFHGMCNGANLAYTKAAFNSVDGFNDIDAIASGDDMLLMHKIAKKGKHRILYLKSKNVIVKTAPVETIGAFLQQRIRWASKADKYIDKSLFPVLLLVYLFNLSLLILFISGMFKTICFKITTVYFNSWELLLMLLIGKTLIELYFLFPVADFFNKKKSLFLFPMMQPFHIIYTIVAGWLGKFGTYRWKERQVN